MKNFQAGMKDALDRADAKLREVIGENQTIIEQEQTKLTELGKEWNLLR